MQQQKDTAFPKEVCKNQPSTSLIGTVQFRGFTPGAPLLVGVFLQLQGPAAQRRISKDAVN